jgi:HlyD family secretion protein
MQKRTLLISLLVIVMLAVITISGCTSRNAAQIPIVATAAASSQEIVTRVDCSGVLVPVQTVEIASKTSGQINSLGFQVGDKVKKGDMLIQLDTEALNGQLLAAEAGLQSARAAAEAAENQSSISKINQGAAQAYYVRTKELFAAGAVAQSTMDDAQDKLDIANQQYATAAGPALSSAEAAVNSAYANMKNIQVQLGNATIKSPIDGIISTQTVNPGQVISANTTVITLVDTSKLKLKTTVGQDRVAYLALGQNMDIEVDSYAGKMRAGTVTAIGPIAISTGEVFPIEITLPNDTNLMAGMSAHTSLIIKAQGLVVPMDAVQQEGGRSKVFVIIDNKAYQREVVTGLQNDKSILITEGLSAGDQVAISNLKALADGMTVKSLP